MKSNMCFVKVFGITVLILILLSQNTTTQQISCGNVLSGVINTLCERGVQKMSLPKKKNSVLPHYGLEGGESDTDILPYPYAGGNSIFMDKINGNIANLIAKTRRRRSNIADECCRKGCSYDELMDYCWDYVPTKVAGYDYK